MQTVQKLGGFVVVLAGFWWVVLPLAFASMIESHTPRELWWGNFWSRFYEGGGIPACIMGVVLMAVGGCLMVGKPNDRVDSSERY